MKTYKITDRPYDGSTTTTRGMVYAVVQHAGETGITRDELAKKVEGLMVLSGAYHRLNDLVKEGYVSVSGSDARLKPWASEPTTTKSDNIIRLDRKPYKWKCPTCGKWVREDIGRSCSNCRPVGERARVEDAL